MNAKHLIAVLSLTAATGAAFAAGPADQAFSGKTRAEVTADLQQAGAKGQLLTSSAAYPFPVAAASTVSRAEVVAAVGAADQKGQLLTSDAAYPFVDKSAASVSRADVKAELTQAMEKGAVPALNQGAA
jgi:hypothetical protein